MSSEVVSYNGTGPLFWTPTTLRDGSGGQRTSGVVAVSFKNTVKNTVAGGVTGIAASDVS
eukprot:COSAG06_NODE_60731_length_270_cov_0.584795_1_plen_59_part_10